MTTRESSGNTNLVQERNQPILELNQFNVNDDDSSDIEENYDKSVRREEAIVEKDTDGILLTRSHSSSSSSDGKQDKTGDTQVESRGVVPYDPVQSMQKKGEFKEHISYVVMMAMFYFEMPSKFYDKVNRSRTLLKLLPKFDHTKKYLAQSMFLQERFAMAAGGGGTADMSPVHMDGDVRVSKTWPDHVLKIQEELLKKEKENE